MEKMTPKNEKQCLQRGEKSPPDEERTPLRGKKRPPPPNGSIIFCIL